MTEFVDHHVPGFWKLQCGGWLLLYLLCLAGSAPHLRELYIFAYNTWVVIVLFAVTVALRPALRAFVARSRMSWLGLHSSLFGLCFVAGSVANYAISLATFGLRGFRMSYWTLSGVHCSLILFLWAALYLGTRQCRSTQDSFRSVPAIPQVLTQESDEAVTPYPMTFAIKTGTRLTMAPVDDVCWIAASKDYAELHTDHAVHLLRETMTSLTQRLDPQLFMRVHRSRIVRTAQIRELISLDNGEYRIRLQDGTEHRSSRTYADALTEWMRRSTGAPSSVRCINPE